MRRRLGKKNTFLINVLTDWDEVRFRFLKCEEYWKLEDNLENGYNEYYDLNGSVFY